MKEVIDELKERIRVLVAENKDLMAKGNLFDYQLNAIRIQTLNQSIIIVNQCA